ncbi:hypothetical protein D5a_00170 [Faustovirus]|nr:hypothetical protein D5a_00170 [Faustovirus]
MMNQITIKNVLKHLHTGNLLLLAKTRECMTVMDFIFENDFHLLLPSALENNFNAQLLVTTVGTKIAKYSSIECIKFYFRNYIHDTGFIERLARYALVRATEDHNWCFVNIIIALMVSNGVECSGVVRRLLHNKHTFSMLLLLLKMCKKYNVRVSVGDFEWSELCNIYTYDKELVGLLIEYSDDVDMNVEDCDLPCDDRAACKLIAMVHNSYAIRINVMVCLLKKALNQKFDNCAQFIYSKIPAEELPNIITSSVTNDDTIVIQFLNNVNKFGDEYAYLCDLCVIHSAICCLRYLIEQCGLRPTQSTYNLSINNPKTKFYSEYLRAYL